MGNRRLLISYAHPDDESFGLGAAVPKWIDDGIDVYLICATDGDAGSVPGHMRGKYATIAALRRAELDCARKILKFKDVYLLDYKDSGMPNSRTSLDPNSLWHSWTHDSDRVIEDVAEVMRQARPQVVVTFNRYGGYGHPDHIAIQRATTRAFHKLNESSNASDARPQKLYYTSYPKATVWMRILSARLRGQDPRRMGRNRDIDVYKILENIEPVHARIPIARYHDIWERASSCHASQGGGRFGRGGRLMRRLLYSNQGFTRVYPVPGHNRVDENDLFAGIVL